MTEAEWLACEDVSAMLGLLAGRVSERKLRLFASACCRRIWHLVDTWHQALGEVLERYADDQATQTEVQSAYETAYDPGNQTPAMAFDALAGGLVINGVSYAVQCAADGASCGAADAATNFPDEPDDDPQWATIHIAECIAQCRLLRDIFGNPFRPVAFDPAWRTSDVLALAQGMYDSRDFGAMPILADALQDAGCDDPDILGHCRGDGPHVRGCWVVDLILGKE